MEHFKSLGWGLRAWDVWYFNDLDQRFGDSWPGQTPAQLVGRTLLYFSEVGDLVFDLMAGGGVVPDTCLAFRRKCWSFDLADRPATRPEIEPFQWNPERLVWPVNGSKKPDLILFDPPYFSKMASQYAEESVSLLSRKEYLKFFRELFPLFKTHSKTNARIAFLDADWPPAPLPASRAYRPEGRAYALSELEALRAGSRREGLSRNCSDGRRSESEYFPFRLHRHHEALRVGNHPYHRLSPVSPRRAGGNTMIPSKHGEADAKKQNPWSCPTVLNHIFIFLGHFFLNISQSP